MPKKSTHNQIVDQRKDHIDPKDPSKATARNKYRPITCLPMMWKILTAQIREEINYSLTSWGWFPDKEKGCCKSRVTLHRSTHPIWEQDKTEKFSYGQDGLQKGIWFGSVKLDNKLPQNEQNITWSHWLYREKPWKPGERNW